MPGKRPFLTRFDAAVLLAGLLAILGLEWAKAPEDRFFAAPPQDMSVPLVLTEGPPESLWLEEVVLEGDAARDFRKEAEGAEYFTAFALGPEGSGRYAWSREASSIADARRIAMNICGADCRIVFERRPQGFIGPESGTLTREQSDIYRQVAGMTGPRAFARSITGYWGWARMDTPAAARGAAMKFCEDAFRPLRGAPEARCEIVAEWP